MLVQASFYGTDNTAMIDAMKEAGPGFRGVAVVDDDVSEDDLKALDEAGVRGVRLNIVDVKDRKSGTLPLEQLKELAERVKPFGWHMELLLHANEFPELDTMLGDFPVDTVFGHLGYMKTDKDVSEPGFQALLRLMAAKRRGSS